MRKGYLFTVDALIAVALLLFAGIVIFNNLPSSEVDFMTDNMAADVVSVLSYTSISDVCTSIGTSTCQCARSYPELQTIVCSGHVQNKDASILELYSELILTGAMSNDQIQKSIHEMFVINNVIDEERFGFALLYSPPGADSPLELYNSEEYADGGTP